MVRSPLSSPSLLLTSTVLALLLTTTTALETLHNRSPAQQPAPATNLTAAIPLSSLATSYPASLSPQNPIAENQIRNTLAHYPLAIDGKDFSSLALVFTADVVANYSEPLGVLTGLPAVVATLEASLAPVATQHALSTQVVEILQGGDGARSVTYYTASHFGQGVHYGQVLYAYGQYQDEWIKTRQEQWRIKARTLIFMGPYIGNLSVFT